MKQGDLLIALAAGLALAVLAEQYLWWEKLAAWWRTKRAEQGSTAGALLAAAALLPGVPP